MEPSKGWVALEAMIEKSWKMISMSEFDQVLLQLEEDGQITRPERRSLLLRLSRKKLHREIAIVTAGGYKSFRLRDVCQ